MKVKTSGRRMVSKERRYSESGTEKETKTISTTAGTGHRALRLVKRTVFFVEN